MLIQMKAVPVSVGVSFWWIENMGYRLQRSFSGIKSEYPF